MHLPSAVLVPHSHALADQPAAGTPRAPRRVTLQEWLAIPEEKRAELIDGRVVYQGMPGPVHGRAQGRILAPLSSAYDRRSGGGQKPGGWWFSLEVDMDIGGLGCRPDILAWRRDKHEKLPEPDDRGLVTAPPDWICEVLSRSTAHVDMGDKRLGYHRAGVAYYWIADPVNGTLTVLEWTAAGYLVAQVKGRGDKVRAEPFPEMEIDVSDLFDDEPAEPAEPAGDPPLPPPR